MKKSSLHRLLSIIIVFTQITPQNLQGNDEKSKTRTETITSFHKVNRFLGLCLNRLYTTDSDKHLTKPQEANSFEVDSMLVGIIQGDGLDAILLTAAASLFAIGSSIGAILNVSNSLHDRKQAIKLKENTLEKISEIDRQLESSDIVVTIRPSNELEDNHEVVASKELTGSGDCCSPEEKLDRELYELELAQNKYFFSDLVTKIDSYLVLENQSIRLNSLIGLGTILEFLGFLFGDVFLGRYYEKLRKSSDYYIAVGLTVVSLSSIVQFLRRVFHFQEIVKYYKESKTKFAVSESSTRRVFDKHRAGFINEFGSVISQELKIDNSCSITSQNFKEFIELLLFSQLSRRVKNRAIHGTLTLVSRLSIGVTTGLLAAHEISLLRNTELFPRLTLNIIGAVTGIGVVFGIAEWFYYLCVIRASPLVDAQGLNTTNVETLRTEIISILLKMKLNPPSKDPSFNDLFSYFVKISPIDRYDNRNATPEQVPFLGIKDSIQNDTMIAKQILHKLLNKGYLVEATKPLIDSLFNSDPSVSLENWAPYVQWDSKANRGLIHWEKVVEDCFLGYEKATDMFKRFILSVIQIEEKINEDELRMTMDRYVKLVLQ